jgi:hypothetical protein
MKKKCLLGFIKDFCDILLQPALKGGSEEIEDYVIEAERLLSLTVVSACTAENPDIHIILRENWSTDVQTPTG